MQELIAALIEATKAHRLAADVAYDAQKRQLAAEAALFDARMRMETLQRKFRSEIYVAAGGEPIPDP